MEVKEREMAMDTGMKSSQSAPGRVLGAACPLSHKFIGAAMSPFVWHNYIITATLATSFPHDSLSQTLPLLIFISQSKLEQNSRDIFVV